MRRGKRPKRKQNHPPRPVDPPPDHYYVICSQNRVWEQRGQEWFWVAKGPVWREMGMFTTRAAAREAMWDHIRNAERGNPFAGWEFYWVKRVNLGAAKQAAG